MTNAFKHHHFLKVDENRFVLREKLVAQNTHHHHGQFIFITSLKSKWNCIVKCNYFCRFTLRLSYKRKSLYLKVHTDLFHLLLADLRDQTFCIINFQTKSNVSVIGARDCKNLTYPDLFVLFLKLFRSSYDMSCDKKISWKDFFFVFFGF